VRKIYETEEDRKNQEEVLKHVQNAWNCQYVKTAHLSSVDGFLCANNQILALVEVKTRKNASDKYPTYMLSANKWRKALELSDQHKVPFMLVVKFTNGVYAAKLKREYPTHHGGRYDRNDAMDVEECVYIPMKEFRQVT